VRPATPAEIRDWDQLVLANPDGGHILQSRAWGEFKRNWGWEPRYHIAEADGRSIALLLLHRRVPGLGTVWYAPRGPGISEPLQLVALLDDLRGLHPGFLVKVDPELPATVDTSSWTWARILRSPVEVQNSVATILVDLRPPEEEIIVSFKPKTRYNIRLAARHGVRVQRLAVDETTIDLMYRLMRSTQRRAGFMLRPRDYFADYWRLQHAAGQGDFFFALLGDEVLAGCFVTRFGERAWYKDGGSSRRHHELMAPHLLQWEVMRWLRQNGVTVYDLVAVPRPVDMSPDHPFYGLYRFKSGFNEHVTEFVGTWDIPLARRRYRLWNTAGERLTRQWAYRVHHDFFF
jgi:lipid II:glycine glycyltransferase (peptidoglycan interpeptide bridge formation enzyme)